MALAKIWERINQVIITESPEDYDQNAKKVIVEAKTLEKMTKKMIKQQKVFQESLVEWSSCREENQPLVSLGIDINQLSIRWTHSQEIFLEALIKVRTEFEILSTFFEESKEYHEKYQDAKNKADTLNAKAAKQGRKWKDQNCAKLAKLNAIAKRRENEYNHYKDSRRHGLVVKVRV